MIAGSLQQPDEGTAAFIYQNGQYTFIAYGGNSSAIYGINNIGDYVANYESLGGCGGGSSLSAGGTNIPLPPGPFATCFAGFARGLNNADEIVGSYGAFGFLVTPVPEPASTFLFASGVAGAALLMLYRKKEKCSHAKPAQGHSQTN